jgi:hypothetical protein
MRVRREVAYFSGLLAWVGCHTDAYEQAKWFGDDIALKRDGYHYDLGRPVDLLNFAWHTVGRGRPPLERLKIWLELPLAVRRNAMVDLRNHWLAADELAGRLGLGEPVRRSLRESFERWDGKGFGGSRGEEIRLTSRVVCLADVVTAYYEQGGENAAVQVARQRSGTQFDPALVELFCANAADVLSGLDGPSQWAQVIDAEPTLARVMTDPEFDAALEAIADFIDLKSPYTLGHSRSVADLSGAAARVLGLPDEDCVAVRRAGLVHDLGRLGVPNSIWDKHGPLTRSEMERVRYACICICPSGCCPRRTPWARSPRSRSSTPSGWTDQVIRGGSTTHPSAWQGGCWEQPIAMRRQQSHGHTERSWHRRRLLPRFAPTFARDASTLTPCRRYWRRPAIAPGGAASSPLG